MRTLIFASLCLTLFFASGCQEEVQQPVETPPASAQKDQEETKELTIVSEQATSLEETDSQAEQEKQEPPKPPVFEDFQGAPKLSLFPRAGDFRPADDSDRLPYWNTFIEHLVKVTGVAEEQSSGNRGWTFRSINTIDSVGFFSPLAVEPQSKYQVSFRLAAELPEGASAGIGILEFDQFLWIPSQYTEELHNKHYRGVHEGKRVTGTTSDTHSFTFTTGPETHMVHVILFREGAHDRNSLMFDDIEITLVKE
ncbi:hypothetical protein P9J64_11505 [Deltaproteobacteria bacterium IMCC39524]|nr:hypothetical protein [Deltaproteobacteria bacterium IMCC39524]